MTNPTEPTIDEIDKIFDTVLDDRKCIADHNDFGGDVIITWTGVWCENCEKPIGDVLPLRDLLSDEKIAQLKALISDQVAKARIETVDYYAWRFDCNTAVSEMYGWRSTLETAKEQTLRHFDATLNGVKNNGYSNGS